MYPRNSPEPASTADEKHLKRVFFAFCLTAVLMIASLLLETKYRSLSSSEVLVNLVYLAFFALCCRVRALARVLVAINLLFVLSLVVISIQNMGMWNFPYTWLGALAIIPGGYASALLLYRSSSRPS